MLRRCFRLALPLGAALFALGTWGPRALAAPAAAVHGSSTPTLGEALQPSSAAQLNLSEHLRRSGVLFYGAWWCPACFKQKNLFGKEAGDRLPYVECDKTEAGRERCQAAGIKAYPTWVRGSERVEGVQTLEELKRWSGYPAAPAAGEGAAVRSAPTTTAPVRAKAASPSP